MAIKLLACNVGSSSLRLEVFSIDDGGTPDTLHAFHGAQDAAGEQLRAAAKFGPFDAVAHRIVHGGRYSLQEAMLLEPPVESEIRRAAYLAPDHNLPALAIIELCRNVFGASPQYAVFDSAFHASIPEHAFTYAIPRAISERLGLRRYGFHGLSHGYSARWVLQRVEKRPLRHVSVHAGNGVSVAAILNGMSQDCTMGFTPMEGAMMGSRSGSIDPGIVLEIISSGNGPDLIRKMLNDESGLLGVSEVSPDYAKVLESANSNERARLALAMYNHRLTGEIARMAASIEGVDVVSFTGGVAEHQPALIREICAALQFLAPSHVLTIEAHETLAMASAVRRFVTQTQLPA